MSRCECCQQEVGQGQLVPVINHDPSYPSRYEMVCSSCEEVISSVHTAFWCLPFFPSRAKKRFSSSVVVPSSVA